MGIWVGACFAFGAAIFAFNAVMDPYLIFGVPRVTGFNARKPAIDTQETLMKAHDVLRALPRTVLLGSSRVDWGINGKSSVWPQEDRPVYNLALKGRGPYASYRYIQHLMSGRHIDLVVVGLDFDFFLEGGFSDPPPSATEFESRLVVGRDGQASAAWTRQYFHDIVQSTLSFDGLIDSVSTLTGNVEGDSSDIVGGNWDWSFFRKATAQVGASPHVAIGNLSFIRYDNGKRINPLVITYVQAILDLCDAQGTRAILLINPMHADMLEILDRVGQWRAFEDWKRQLLSLTARFPGKDGRSRIPLWDFSSYDHYSTEQIPPSPGALHWYWDSSHYTRALGDAVIERILGKGDLQFGVLLDSENLEPHLRAIRIQQLAYRAEHAADARRVQNLYEAAIGVPSQTVARAH
jgi:hypothetical protein